MPFIPSPENPEIAKRVEDFRQMLRDPDDIWVKGSLARKRFGLTGEDMAPLKSMSIMKENPYELGMSPFRQYPLKEVVKLAMKKHGEEWLLRHYNRLCILRLDEREMSERLYNPDAVGAGHRADKGEGTFFKNYWYNAPSATTIEGRQSIIQGLKTNMSICFMKGAVWYGTGSHAMFADWMHSIADVANYSYRLLEVSRSAMHRDISHPYGYGPLRYITADRSFLFLGFVGGLWPLGLGLRELLEAVGGSIKLVDNLAAPAAVFLASAFLEGAAVRTAYREILSQADAEQVGEGRRPSERVTQYLREGRDVMSTATFTEASSGVLGAAVGMIGLGASWYFQNGAPDVVASVLMASMVCGLSSFLLQKSGMALLGQTLPGWRVEALVIRLEGHAAVVNVYDVKTEMVGTDTVRFKAEVQFNPQAITERMLQDPSVVGKEAHAGEAHAVLAMRLQEMLPQLRLGLHGTRSAEPEVAAWLYKNNSLFYEALAWELKDAERVLRGELQDFRNVHIDLEPW